MVKPFFAPLAAAFLLLLSGPLFAQGAGPGASEIDKILENPEISFAQASAFIVEASEAPAVAKPAVPSPDRPIKLGELSFLIMKSFNVKGSFLYALFPGPRYGYRDMNYLRFLPEPSDPSMKVSGIQLLQIVERVLNYLEPGNNESKVIAAETETVDLAAEREAALAAARAAALEAEREQMMAEIRDQIAKESVANTTVRLVDEGVTISVSDIQFAGDSAVLVESERIKIMQIAVMLQRYPGRPILVGGHTALAGTVAGRNRISQERAQSVADFLVYLGCRTTDEITVRGYGSDRPVADNGTAAGQALNRRVEITLLNRE